MLHSLMETAPEEKQKPKTEAEHVGLWHERITIAKKCHEDWVQSSGAKRFNDEYSGKFEVSFHGRRGKIPVPPINDVFAYVQSDIAATYNRDPYISVVPRAGSVIGSKLLEVLLNYEWREQKVKEEIEYEIMDKDLVGYGWHKVGHTVQSEGTGEQLKIIKQSLYSMRLAWGDVLWNIGARRPPFDCQWMAQRIVRPLDDIKARHPNAKTLKGAMHPDIDENTYKKALYKDDIDVCVFYEIWDARTKKIYKVAEGLKDKYLDDPIDWPPYLDEFPFLMYFDFIVPGSPRPMSAIAPWEPQILEKMVLLASAINHCKRWNRQMIVNNGAIDENALDKFERGDDGAIITNNGTGEIDKNIKLLDFGPLPTDFYQVMDRLDAIARYINGQPEFFRGGVTKTSTRTDGELDKIGQGAKWRVDRKIDRLESHLENIARHMLAHLKGNFDFEKTVKVVGETPEEVIQQLGDLYDPTTQTATFSENMITGEYDVEVRAGSTLPLNEETQEAVLRDVMTNVAQVAARGPMSPFLNAVIQELLSKYKIKSLEEAYKLEFEMAREQMAKSQGQASIEDTKVMADADKRTAQAKQITAETEITMQEANMGPEGRAMMKKAERPEPSPVAIK